MPISVKLASLNFKDGIEYNNANAFFLGDITGEATEWLSKNAFLGYTVPELFGAVGDGITDDTQAWKDCIASGKIIVATKQYLCSEPLYLDNDTYIFGRVINNTSDGIKISGKSNHTYFVNVSATSEVSINDFVGMEVINCNVCTVRCATTNFKTGLKLTGDGSGCAYNHIESCYILNSMYSIYLTAKNNGWCNENYFYNLRNINWTGSQYSGANYGITINKDSSAQNAINSNHFLNMCYEGSYCAINVVNGIDNSFENIRTEGCTYAALFGINTARNIVWFLHGTTTYTDESSQTVKNAVVTIPDIIAKFTA